MVVFDRAGRVVSADLGSDRLSVLTLETAPLSIAGRYAARAGDGPRQIAIHPDGRLLFVANELDASVAWYRYDPDEGKIVGRLGQVKASRGNTGGVAMVLDAEGEFLYTTTRSGGGGVSMWRIARGTGSLERLQVEGGPPLHEIAMTADAKCLLGLGREDGAVFGWRIANGRLSRGVELTRIASPMSIATKSL
jgi:6-phosphogluconolactonase (cycloisomerase 2 family)